MKQKTLRFVACLLALVMLLSSFSSCAGKGKKLLTMKKDGISVSFSVNLYEFLLSRSKGLLVASRATQNGASPTQNAFWDYQDTFDGTTFQSYDAFYSNSVLNTCKVNMIAEYLFKREKLRLSATQKENVQKMMDELLRTDGGGSKNKLNAVLGKYGVNYDLLKNFYTLEYKIETLKTHLYGANASNVGDNVKNQFMNEYYVHFRQIYLTSQPVVYLTDSNDEEIYFRTEEGQTHRICYDTGNGVTKTEDGEVKKDSNGDEIYYVDDGTFTKIAYDNVKGEPQPATDETTGEVKVREMTKEEKNALNERVSSLLEKAKTMTAEEFEQLLSKESDGDTDVSEYTDGIYLRTDLDYSLMGDGQAYLNTIASNLTSMQQGDVCLVESPTGYHIIRKYENTPNAYSNAANESYFENFNANLINKLFLDECHKYVDYIKINEKVLAKAPSMKTVEVNSFY
ncbi:MAG: hypothetical protein E7637_04715 [Ruminococcaceae bacterium]|nr:hypothetical protein [Oscillospiraceae bacterium]